VSRDLGDRQTPHSLAERVIKLLLREGVQFERVLEPTCGEGSFIQAAAPFASDLLGLEIQANHVAKASERFKETENVAIAKANIFDTDLARIEWRAEGPLLIVGNPPWVTNAELSRLSSVNTPIKSNIKKLSGYDALTGASNFDIAEYIVLKCLLETAVERPTLAMLVKTGVARKVLEFAFTNNWPVTKASLHRIDSKQHFDASVDACLFTISLDETRPKRFRAEVFESLDAGEPSATIGFTGAELVGDIVRYEHVAHIDGRSPIEWRQGAKHDASKIMELRVAEDQLVNGFGEEVDVEPNFVYPLIKSTDLARDRKPTRMVIVTQRRVGDDTSLIQVAAPKLWAYLQHHRDALDSRRSSIYRNRPPFSMFGLGDYTFTDWKVAVSGLHKVPEFRLIGPVDGRPVVFDDTCYLVPCSSEEQAQLVFALLKTDAAKSLILSLIFPDSKRPVTKKLLQRIDLTAVIASNDRDSLIDVCHAELGEYPLWKDRSSDELAALLGGVSPLLTVSGQIAD
jgi:hypothetical protein